MRKIYEIFAATKQLPEPLKHWTELHGNPLTKKPSYRYLKAHVHGIDTYLRGVAIKSFKAKQHYKVLFDRNFLVAKAFQVILQFHNAGIKPEAIKDIMNDAFDAFERELKLEKESVENESGH
mgnify:CR=1 FL=1